MTKAIDPDQQTVYFAEGTVFENTLFDEVVSDTDIETLANELFDSDWWQSQWIPRPNLSLRRLEASTSEARTYHPSEGRAPEIRFCTAQVDPRTLAHEASHVACNSIFNYWKAQNVQSHGQEFRATYVAVTEILLGKQAADDLEKAFKHFLPHPTHIYIKPISGSIDPEGIFPRWRTRRQVEDLRRAGHRVAQTSDRINGAIAL